MPHDITTTVLRNLDLGNGNFAYAFGNYSKKFVDGGFYFRNPDTRAAVFATTLTNPKSPR